DLAHDPADVLSAVRDVDAEELLDGARVAEVVDEGRDVVEAVGVGNGIVVRADLAVLLEGAVEVADLHVRLHHRLAVELREDADDAVHGGMRGAEVHEHVLAALAARGRPLAQEQLSGRPFAHGHISILLASPSAAARTSLRSAPISIIARLAFGCGSPPPPPPPPPPQLFSPSPS